MEPDNDPDELPANPWEDFLLTDPLPLDGSPYGLIREGYPQWQPWLPNDPGDHEMGENHPSVTTSPNPDALRSANHDMTFLQAPSNGHGYNTRQSSVQKPTSPEQATNPLINATEGVPLFASPARRGIAAKVAGVRRKPAKNRKCDLCEHVFSRATDLVRHKTSKHKIDKHGNKPPGIRCSEIGCQSGLFYRNDHLQAHFARKHTKGHQPVESQNAPSNPDLALDLATAAVPEAAPDTGKALPNYGADNSALVLTSSIARAMTREDHSQVNKRPSRITRQEASAAWRAKISEMEAECDDKHTYLEVLNVLTAKVDITRAKLAPWQLDLFHQVNRGLSKQAQNQKKEIDKARRLCDEIDETMLESSNA